MSVCFVCDVLRDYAWCVFVCVCVWLPLLFNEFVCFVLDVLCDVVWSVFVCVLRVFVCVIVLSVFVCFVCGV